MQLHFENILFFSTGKNNENLFIRKIKLEWMTFWKSNLKDWFEKLVSSILLSWILCLLQVRNGEASLRALEGNYLLQLVSSIPHFISNWDTPVLRFIWTANKGFSDWFAIGTTSSSACCSSWNCLHGNTLVQSRGPSTVLRSPSNPHTYCQYHWFPAHSGPCSCRREIFGKRGSFYACHWMTAEEEKEGQNKGCLMSVWTKAQTSSFVEADSYNHIMQCISQFNTHLLSSLEIETGTMTLLISSMFHMLSIEKTGSSYTAQPVFHKFRLAVFKNSGKLGWKKKKRKKAEAFANSWW